MQSSPANAERLLQQGSPGEADGSLYTQLPKSGPKLPSLRILTPDSCYKKCQQSPDLVPVRTLDLPCVKETKEGPAAHLADHNHLLVMAT